MSGFPAPKNLQFYNITHTDARVEWDLTRQIDAYKISHYVLKYKKIDDVTPANERQILVAGKYNVIYDYVFIQISNDSQRLVKLCEKTIVETHKDMNYFCFTLKIFNFVQLDN